MAPKNLDGGAERDRTADLLIANEALSQLSYGPAKAPRPSALHNLERVWAIYGPWAAESRMSPNLGQCRGEVGLFAGN